MYNCNDKMIDRGIKNWFIISLENHNYPFSLEKQIFLAWNLNEASFIYIIEISLDLSILPF